MAQWFGAHYNQEVSFSSAVMLKKGPHVLTSLANQRRNFIIIITIIIIIIKERSIYWWAV